MAHVNSNAWKMMDISYLHLQVYVSFHNDHFNELIYGQINLLSLNNDSLETFSYCCLCRSD